MKKIILIFFITFSLSAKEYDLGSNIYLSFDNFHKGTIKIYNSLSLGVSSELKFTNKENFIFISKYLISSTDSLKAPEAFEIIQNDKHYLQCLRYKVESLIEKPESCAIQKEIDNSPIVIHSHEYKIKCQEGIFE